MAELIKLFEYQEGTRDEHYLSEDGVWKMYRGYEGESPNGNAFNGRWVLTKNGKYVDYDQYRYDLASRYDLELLTVGPPA